MLGRWAIVGLTQQDLVGTFLLYVFGISQSWIVSVLSWDLNISQCKFLSLCEKHSPCYYSLLIIRRRSAINVNCTQLIRRNQ
jgi:hypothetical protein